MRGLAYRQFGGDSSPIDGLFLAGGNGPQHVSCAIFGALVCPWLRRPGAIARKTTGVARDPIMVIMGFIDYGLALQPPPHPDLPTYAYAGPTDFIQCADRSQLVAAYERALAIDDVDTSERLYWPDPEDQQHLADLARQDEATLTELWESATPWTDGYRLARLFAPPPPGEKE
jgi:hypothetical protein